MGAGRIPDTTYDALRRGVLDAACWLRAGCVLRDSFGSQLPGVD